VWPPSARQSAREAIEELMRSRGLTGGFDRQVQRAASQARDRVPGAGWGDPGRRDLRDLPTFTIDPQSARDFDDALSAESLPDAGTRVWVHIADVAAYVPEGSPVDLEARRRGTSVYVPGGVEPMLPAVLSNDACSLVAGADRLAVTAELELRGAEVARASFYRSLIRSDARLDYERVDRIFARREAAQAPWAAPLDAARRAAAALQRVREQRGALVLDSEEPEFVFDEQGNVSEIRARTQTEAHRLIEHLMIATNEAVARLLQQRRVPCLYRVHERPDPQSVARLIDQLASLDVPTPPMAEHMTPSQAADLVGEISRLVDQTVRRTGRGRLALGSLVLRSLKQAYYSPSNLGHAGLRSAAYCHFTSPIRRHPDLVSHRALLSTIGGGERAPRARELVELGAWASERERAAMTIERDADDIARCFALEQLLYEAGWERTFSGEVVGLISAGAFIAFGGAVAGGGAPAPRVAPEPAAQAPGAHVFEGLLPMRRMRARPARGDARAARDAGAGTAEHAEEWWELNELGTILRGQRTGATLRLGEPIDVRVARVDAPRGRVDLIGAVAQRDG
jgi:ribonuclease R